MILFYQPNILEPIHTLDLEESRHCIKVLRKKAGDIIHLTDGAGKFCEGQILDESPKRCAVEILNTRIDQIRESFRLHIAVAPTKNISRFEWFLEKATEIGVDDITPIFCENSERKVIKIQRLQKVMIAAMKQSLKAFLPVLNEARTFENFIKGVNCKNKFIAYCSDDYRDLLKDQYQAGSDVMILIGPEGDFSPKEIEMAIQHDFKPISLGKSRLRTETAGLAACFTIQLINETAE